MGALWQGESYWKDGRWNNLAQQDVTLSTKGHFIVPLCISLSHKWGDLHVHGFLCVIHLEYYAHKYVK